MADAKWLGCLPCPSTAGGTGASGHLAALAGLHLNIVQQCANADIGQRQRITRTNLGIRAGTHGIARTQSLRSQDVSLVAVAINN